jgi:hypothetical protein
MLELFTRHGAFDLELKCDGDLDVDQHHTVEDVGIALGEAFDRALGDKRGILRAGYFLMPMDETLAIAAVDLSGRAAFAVDTKGPHAPVGDLQTELVTDFLRRLRPRRARQRSREDHVRPLESSQDRSHLQSLCARAPRSLLARQATRRHAALTQRTAVMRVTVIDYKAGNLTSVLKALRHLGAEPKSPTPISRLSKSAERIVLPGVGHFRRHKAISTRPASPRHPRSASRAAFRSSASASACNGSTPAQAKLPINRPRPLSRAVRALSTKATKKFPHVGWNSLEVRSGSRLACRRRAPASLSTSRTLTKLPVTACRHRGHHALHRALRAAERRQCDGRPVSSGKIRRTGLKILRNFLAGREGTA